MNLKGRNIELAGSGGEVVSCRKTTGGERKESESGISFNHSDMSYNNKSNNRKNNWE
jgi:hypothetical protein